MGGFEGLGDKGSLRRWLPRDTAACGTRSEVTRGYMGTVRGAMLVLPAGGPRASFDSTPQLVMADGRASCHRAAAASATGHRDGEDVALQPASGPRS